MDRELLWHQQHQDGYVLNELEEDLVKVQQSWGAHANLFVVDLSSVVR
jgi:hypothetical protein